MPKEKGADEIFVSESLLTREVGRLASKVISLDELLPQVEMRPTAILTHERARHFFQDNFVSRDEVIAALNQPFSQVFHGMALCAAGEDEIGFTEQHAAFLADGSWMCVWLPAMPLTVIVALITRSEIEDKDMLVQSIAYFIKESQVTDVHDMVHRVFSIGIGKNAISGYRLVSREAMNNVEPSAEASRIFKFQRAGYDLFWPLLLVQSLLFRPLIKACAYEHIRIMPGRPFAFPEYNLGENSKLMGSEFLGIASPK